MNLTTVRRLVVVGNVLALAAAGAAAWHSLQAERAAPKDWAKILPSRPATAADADAQGPSPNKDLYSAAAGWPQGEKPRKEDPAATGPVAPPPDPFKTKYRLNGVFVSPDPFESYAQIATGSGNAAVTFSIGVGERIPQDPGTRGGPATPWRLDSVRAGGTAPGGKEFLPAAALFRNVDTDEEQTLEIAFEPGADLTAAPSGAPGGGAGIGTSVAPGVPPEAQPLRARLVRKDPDAVVWEFPDSEVEWLDAWGEKQAASISTVPSKDAQGNPDGFVLKGVAPGSRVAELGFKAEDKVISVNGERVNSTEQAVSTGRRQYDGGTSTFTIKVLRAGKERNFTFHAPPKKKPKPR